MKRHINEFVRLNCAADMLALKLFPNAKEITESMAAYHAVRSHLLKQCEISLDDPKVNLICVGDGHTPRTAALFAFRSGWNCTSIDPVLREKEYPIKRLTLLRKKIEDTNLDSIIGVAIVVMVHSHAPMQAVLEHIKATRLHIVSIPCCVPHEIHGRYYLGYQDTAIWSPQNTVKIWRNV